MMILLAFLLCGFIAACSAVVLVLWILGVIAEANRHTGPIIKL